MSISRRISIAWNGGAASEDCDVLVLTGKRYFLDIRVNLEIGKLDWAFAGTRTSVPGDEQGKSHCTWSHIVDSHRSGSSDLLGSDKSKLVHSSDKDEGTVYMDPANPLRCIEHGMMLNPKTGQIESHEEIWVDEDLPPGTMVQFWEREDGKAFVGMIGAHMMSIGEDWAWRTEQGKPVYSFGNVDGSLGGRSLRYEGGGVVGGRNGSWIIQEVWQT